MPEVDDLEVAFESVAWRCHFKHDFGCECWRNGPEHRALRKRDIRARLAQPSRPLPLP